MKGRKRERERKEGRKGNRLDWGQKASYGPGYPEIRNPEVKLLSQMKHSRQAQEENALTEVPATSNSEL